MHVRMLLRPIAEVGKKSPTKRNQVTKLSEGRVAAVDSERRMLYSARSSCVSIVVCFAMRRELLFLYMYLTQQLQRVKGTPPPLCRMSYSCPRLAKVVCSGVCVLLLSRYAQSCRTLCLFFLCITAALTGHRSSLKPFCYPSLPLPSLFLGRPAKN